MEITPSLDFIEEIARVQSDIEEAKNAEEVRELNDYVTELNSRHHEHLTEVYGLYEKVMLVDNVTGTEYLIDSMTVDDKGHMNINTTIMSDPNTNVPYVFSNDKDDVMNTDWCTNLEFVEEEFDPGHPLIDFEE